MIEKSFSTVQFKALGVHCNSLLILMDRVPQL